jgi:adenylate cyclase
VYRFLSKPWNKEELKMVIDSAIQFQQLEQSNSKLYIDLENTMDNLKMTLKRFKQYIPEAVVEEALKATEEGLLKGERREVTALFCDIRNFTTISEELEPEEVFEILQEFYKLMTETVKKHQGTIPQFIGDEVFAVFGAPVRDNQSALNAVYCAFEMLENGKQLNKMVKANYNLEINIGIGINRGIAIVGNLGSSERITYTVIGDTINTAKRIESLTRLHYNKILIGDTIQPLIENFIETIAWDPLPIKGKKGTITVHEAVGLLN